MDNRERYADPEEAIRSALDSFRTTLWTALPAIVQSFDAVSLTVVVQPAIQGVVYKPDAHGNLQAQFVNLPLLSDVPVFFPRGGPCTLTFPIAAGDECLVVFASRCIDMWWQNGGVQPPFETTRMLDLSDGFAFIGPFSKAKAIQSYSQNKVQLRSNDGSTYVELDPAGQIVNIVAPGGVSINAPTVTITGSMTVSQTIAAQLNISSQTDVTSGSISLKNHLHSGVAAGGALTGAPQ